MIEVKLEFRQDYYEYKNKDIIKKEKTKLGEIENYE